MGWNYTADKWEIYKKMADKEQLQIGKVVIQEEQQVKDRQKRNRDIQKRKRLAEAKKQVVEREKRKSEEKAFWDSGIQHFHVT